MVEFVYPNKTIEVIDLQRDRTRIELKKLIEPSEWPILYIIESASGTGMLETDEGEPLTTGSTFNTSVVWFIRESNKRDFQFSYRFNHLGASPSEVSTNTFLYTIFLQNPSQAQSNDLAISLGVLIPFFVLVILGLFIFFWIRNRKIHMFYREKSIFLEVLEEIPQIPEEEITIEHLIGMGHFGFYCWPLKSSNNVKEESIRENGNKPTTWH